MEEKGRKIKKKQSEIWLTRKSSTGKYMIEGRERKKWEDEKYRKRKKINK